MVQKRRNHNLVFGLGSRRLTRGRKRGSSGLGSVPRKIGPQQTSPEGTNSHNHLGLQEHGLSSSVVIVDGGGTLVVGQEVQQLSPTSHSGTANEDTIRKIPCVKGMVVDTVLTDFSSVTQCLAHPQVVEPTHL